MNNIVSYAEEQLNTFHKDKFSSVDSLILSWISYMHMPSSIANVHNWQGVYFYELFKGECFNEMFSGIWDEESSRKLFTAMVASPRFRNMKVMGYKEESDFKTEKQFSALCFQLNEELCYIAFRGTDSTLVGWKEDFNMAFQYPVPSQLEAEKFLKEAVKHCTGKILIGGHSKGGNLAVSSALNCDSSIKNRIETIYSHDGPGFLESVLKSNNFKDISSKIEKTLPQSSLVGMLLENQENFNIIKSNKVSFLQHDPFSWIVENNDFCYLPELTADARFLDATLNRWISSLSNSERERFVDSLYGILNINQNNTLTEFRYDFKRNLPAIIQAASKMDGDTKNFLQDTIKGLFTLGLKSFPEIFKI